MLDTCPVCGGTGILNEPPYVDGTIYCQDCGGSGEIDFLEIEEE